VVLDHNTVIFQKEKGEEGEGEYICSFVKKSRSSRRGQKAFFKLKNIFNNIPCSLVDLFNQIRKKLVIFVHFKGFNISQKPKSSPLSYFAQKTS
jgi:hypothetical protein